MIPSNSKEEAALPVQQLERISLEEEQQLRACMERMWRIFFVRGCVVQQLDQEIALTLPDGESKLVLPRGSKVWFPLTVMRQGARRAQYAINKMHIALPDGHQLSIFACKTQFRAELRTVGGSADRRIFSAGMLRGGLP